MSDAIDRRTILVAGGVAALAGAPVSAQQTTPAPALAMPGLTFVFEATVLIGTPIEQGIVDGVRKRIIPITGGSFAGPRVAGAVLPGGADWQNVRGDGTAEIFARYTLKAQDGTVIGIENPGFRRGPAAVLARIAAGEAVDPALYYFRTAPRFIVGEGPHRWLAESVFVATAARYSDKVVFRTFAVE